MQKQSFLLAKATTFVANRAGIQGGAVYCGECSLTLRGRVTFEHNGADEGGAIFGTTARLLATPENFALVEVTVSGLEQDGWFAMFDQHDPLQVHDCRGRFTGGSVFSGDPTTFAFCVPVPSELQIEGYDYHGFGWGENSSLRVACDDVKDLVELTVEPGLLVAAEQFVTGTSAATTAEAPVFRDNVARRGGAINLEDSTSAELVGGLFEDNVAWTSEEREGGGGGLRAVRGVSLDVFNVTLRGNRADHSAGGGVYVKQCDTVAFEACSAFANVANLGGFLSSEQALDRVTLKNTVLHANEAYHDGGGISLREGDYVGLTVQTSTFADNVAGGAGGALSSSKSHVAIEGCTFVSNAADNGGAVAVFDNAETNTTFQGGACTPVEVFIDFRDTDYACLPSGPTKATDWHLPTTCPQLGTTSCLDDDVPIDCRGCACVFDNELRIYEQDAASTILRAVPISGGIGARQTCVSGSHLLARAFDSLEEDANTSTWWGGSFYVRVQETFFGPYTPQDGLVRVELPQPRHIEMHGNAAHHGGGAVFWDARGPEVSGLRASNNTAMYGGFVATPARTLEFVDSSPSGKPDYASSNATTVYYHATSGELADQPMRVAIFDAYGQVVCRGADDSYARIASVQGDQGTAEIQDGFAPFVDGVAEFRTLIVKDAPGSRIAAQVDSPLESLGHDTSLEMVIRVRACGSGETLAPDGRSCLTCQSYEYEKDGECIECTDGMACDTPGTTLSQVVIEKNYWRAAVDSEEVLRCPETASNCKGGPGTGACDNKFSGRLCSVCDGMYRLHGNQCRKCQGRNTGLAVSLSLIVSLLVFAALRATAKTPTVIVDRENELDRLNNPEGRTGSFKRTITRLKSFRRLPPQVTATQGSPMQDSTAKKATMTTEALTVADADETSKKANTARMLRLYSKLSNKW